MKNFEKPYGGPEDIGEEISFPLINLPDDVWDGLVSNAFECDLPLSDDLVPDFGVNEVRDDSATEWEDELDDEVVVEIDSDDAGATGIEGNGLVGSGESSVVRGESSESLDDEFDDPLASRTVPNGDVDDQEIQHYGLDDGSSDDFSSF